MAITPLLVADSLSLVRGRAPLLGDVSFSLGAGELVILAGPNGAGKSTLLHLLAGQSEPTQGTLTLDGQACHQFSRAQWAQKVTLVPQHSALGFPLTAEEVVSLGGLAHQDSVVALRQQVQQALHDWDIHYLAQRDVRQLSGGEQQRCQLARSWIQVRQSGSRLWLLDEPLSALDLRHQQQCLQHIRALTATGRTVVMVEHDLNLARRYADRVLLLSCGRLVADGAAADVLSAEQVAETFRIDAVLENGFLQWR
ncbi:ATP-binding cassette domain-containing protein [Thalassolituus sp. LLYu03]|uniref:ATP-binding cassette domain-containing protein n=1 Tax=Thalassolituus sp. LLYu03 TaxID=3421656 RepID=UPI003D2C2FAC